MNSFIENRNIRTVVLGIIVLISVLFGLLLSTPESIYIEKTDTSQAFDNIIWHLEDEDKNIELPYPVSGAPYESFTITTTLPLITRDDMTMMLNSCNSVVEVYIDNEKIYTFGELKDTSEKRIIGDFKCIIPLERVYGCKTLKIVYTPVISYDGTIPTIYFNTYSNQFYNVLYSNLFYISILSAQVIFIVLAIGFGLICGKNELHIHMSLINNYLLFIISIAIWTWANSDLPQFLPLSGEVISLITYLAIAYATVPLLGIFIELLPELKKPLEFMQLVGFCITIINVIGYLLNVLLPSSVVALTQIMYLAITLFLLFCCFFQRSRHKTNMPYLNIGSCLFVFLGLAGLYCSFKYPDTNLNVKFISISVLVFSAGLFLEIMSFQSTTLKEQTTNKTMERVAYTDGLTSLANRTAFYRFVDEIKEKPSTTKVSIISIDVANLREINETRGHTAGDILLQNAADVICSAYKNKCSIFKIDGNDFEVVFLDSPLDEGELEDMILNAVSIHNMTSPYMLKFSIGIATSEIKGDVEAFMMSLLDQARENKKTDR